MKTPVYMVFDTETTGLPPRAERGAPPIPADDPRQPRLASFAAILADEAGAEVSRHKFYVRPEGWTMAEMDRRAIADGKLPASAINGLADEFLNANGVPVAEVLEFYSWHILEDLIPVAFNSQFDVKVMRGELRRAGMPDLFEQTRHICAMRALDPYGAEGLCISRGYVKLSEACAWFKIVNEAAHDAMGDAVATREILAILIRDGRLPEPSINYASNRAA